MLGIHSWSRSAGMVRQISLPQPVCVCANGFLRRQSPVNAWGGVRRETTEAGADKSGHILAGPNEGIFFLDSEQILVSCLLQTDRARYFPPQTQMASQYTLSNQTHLYSGAYETLEQP